MTKGERISNSRLIASVLTFFALWRTLLATPSRQEYFSLAPSRTVSGWVTGLNTRGGCEIFYAFEVDGVTYQSTRVSRYMTKPKGSSALCAKARLLEKGWTVPVTFPGSQPQQAIAFARAPRLEAAFLLATLAAWLVEWRNRRKAEGPGKRVSPLSGP